MSDRLAKIEKMLRRAGIKMEGWDDADDGVKVLIRQRSDLAVALSQLLITDEWGTSVSTDPDKIQAALEAIERFKAGN